MRSAGTTTDRPGNDGPFRNECTACDATVCRILKRDGCSRQRSLTRGARLDGQGCLKLWTVVDGVTALCSAMSDGRRQIVCLSMPGDTICPVSGSDVWVEALTPSTLCGSDLGPHDGPIERDAALSAELFRIAHRQVKDVSAHLAVLGRLDGMERVCLFLADMVWRMGDKTAEGWRVQLPLSREDIADYLGLNAETVSRLFGRVKKAGLATFVSPTEYVVPDIHALQGHAPMLPPNAPRQERPRPAAERALHLV